MVATYEEFVVEHRVQHVSAFNGWCAVVGNSSLFPTAAALLLRRPRVAAAIFSLGTAVLFAGHIADGTLLQSTRDFARHPIWGTRADFALANATIRSALGS